MTRVSSNDIAFFGSDLRSKHHEIRRFLMIGWDRIKRENPFEELTDWVQYSRCFATGEQTNSAHRGRLSREGTRAIVTARMLLSSSPFGDLVNLIVNQPLCCWRSTSCLCWLHIILGRVCTIVYSGIDDLHQRLLQVPMDRCVYDPFQSTCDPLQWVRKIQG